MRRGLTLIEVMVALAIFALAAIVLGAAYVNVLVAYDAAQRSNQTDQDLRFARGQLLAEADRDKAEKGNDFDTAGGRRVKWHATIETTTIADLFQVTFVCEVAEASAASPATVTETFTLLRPTWADAVENAKLRQDASDRIKEMQGVKR